MTISESNRRIVLLTAGIGARLGSVTEKRNKTLLSINNKAILSYILDTLPKDVPVVIALGHFGDQVRSFLETAHPERTFVFKTVNPYAGPGSSSGYSLFSMRQLVPGPFIFCTNDTIIRQPIKFEGRNWVGVSISDDIEKYTTVSIFGTRVTQVYRKGEVGGALAYTGLAEIHDYDLFWKSLGGALKQQGECSDIEGLYGLLSPGLFAKQVEWLDTGTKDRFDHAVQVLGSGSHLPKEDEDIYFQNGQVIKFYSDPGKASQRVARAKLLDGLVPEINMYKGCFYSYEWIRGEMLSEVLTPDLFRSFLRWADERLWQPKRTLAGLDVHRMAYDFYYRKTQARLNRLYTSGYVEDAPYTVNGTQCERACVLLEALGDGFFADGVFTSFHGDLHPDNILVTENGSSFKLLDWRENFGGCLEVGDMYYDLAKLYHGLLVSHDFIKVNQFKVSINNRIINVDIPIHFRNIECIEILEGWVEARGLSVSRLRTLVALIYLNISPLHHYPYNQFLFFFGLALLQRALDERGERGVGLPAAFVSA